MTSRDFCYWLQGFYEITGGAAAGLTAEQSEIVKRHLAMVFAHEIDPQAGPPAHQKVLSDIHNPPDIRPTTAPDICPKNTLLRC